MPSVCVTVHRPQQTTQSVLVNAISPFTLFEHGVESSSNDEPTDFARARADFIQLGVSQESAHRVIVDVAIPTCWWETNYASVVLQSTGTGLRWALFEPGINVRSEPHQKLTTLSTGVNTDLTTKPHSVKVRLIIELSFQMHVNTRCEQMCLELSSGNGNIQDRC